MEIRLVANLRYFSPLEKSEMNKNETNFKIYSLSMNHYWALKWQNQDIGELPDAKMAQKVS